MLLDSYILSVLEMKDFYDFCLFVLFRYGKQDGHGGQICAGTAVVLQVCRSPVLPACPPDHMQQPEKGSEWVRTECCLLPVQQLSHWTELYNSGIRYTQIEFQIKCIEIHLIIKIKLALCLKCLWVFYFSK